MAALVVVGILGVAYVTYITSGVSMPKPPWLFKGAYAQYSGSTTYLESHFCGCSSSNGCMGGGGCPNRTITTSEVIHLEVLAYNTSKVDMLYFTNTSSTFPDVTYQGFIYGPGPPDVTNTSEWVTVASAPSLFPQSPYQPPALNMAYANTSSTTITLHNQSYTVTDYLYLVNNSTRIDIFASQSVGFPIEYAMQQTSAGNIKVTTSTWAIDITQTNIPGLQSIASAAS